MNEPSPTQTNVVLVLVDDMGFADIGLMGSEIRTPAIDALGANAPVEADLQAQFDEWAERVGVRDWNELEPIVQEAWGMEDLHG